MLAQFQSKYPQGSLISELVQIYHGKYIVRSSVIIDGVTRATGMAAAETPEEAEDRARHRALVVLGISSLSQESVVVSPEPVQQVQSTPSLTITNEVHESDYSPARKTFAQTEVTPPRFSVPPVTDKNDIKNQDIIEHFPENPAVVSSVITKNDNNSQEIQEITEHFPTYDQQETQFETSLEDLGIMSSNKVKDIEPIPEISPSNVTPFPSRSYSKPQEDIVTQTTTGKKRKKSEPVDQSDDIARIGVEMQRLGWTTEQGRDYLIKTYGKRSRHLLSDEELRDFLKYLESQPTPPDPLAGF
ncbi:hypothetical protein BZZ01_31590 [Nostocales cyanobacterium HT-58-2]|nr:hypothetical protein BZZ01_31590 [Nostocales cyanobacterium HT-58-2]